MPEVVNVRLSGADFRGDVPDQITTSPQRKYQVSKKLYAGKRNGRWVSHRPCIVALFACYATMRVPLARWRARGRIASARLNGSD